MYRGTDMKIKLVQVCIVIVTLLGLLACSPASKDIWYAWDQKTEIGAGELLTVNLQSNPTTGFEWELREITNETVLQLVESKYELGEEAKKDPPVPGAGGHEIWTFKTLKKGESTIFMDYNQPWEGGMKAVHHLILRVTVK